MKKYKKQIAVAVILALAYYFFFYKKASDNILSEDDKDQLSADPGPKEELPVDPTAKGTSALNMKQSVIMHRPPINHIPTTAGKWYGRDRGAAQQASRDTGCTYVEGPNGTYGCF